MTYLLALVLGCVAVAGIRYGAEDDSPGLVLLCLLLLLGAGGLAARRVLRGRGPSRSA